MVKTDSQLQKSTKKEKSKYRCSDCRHFKDRYVLYMDGPFPTLQTLLDKGLITSKDFMCEGYGCIFQPCQDFTSGINKEDIMALRFQDLQDNMEKLCENFEQRNPNESILVKNIEFRTGDRQYYVFDKQEKKG